jgi:hypothetical protein
MIKIDNKTTCVYFHRKSSDNTIFYVGIGNIKRPFIKNKKLRGNWWFNVVNKHGLIVEIIHENLSWKEACSKEKYYIKLFGRRDLKTGILINLTEGGDGVKGAIRKKESIEKTRNFNLGSKRTDICKIKMSLASKGKDKLYKRKPVVQYSLTMEFIKKWDSATSAERYLKINKSNITACCKNKYGFKTAGGFIWKYEIL